MKKRGIFFFPPQNKIFSEQVYHAGGRGGEPQASRPEYFVYIWIRVLSVIL